jgi:DNA-binding transcriptional MerR regulator
MRIQYFRPPDIAKRTGIPEGDVCRYLEIYDEFFTYGEDGEDRLYTPDVLLLIESIRTLDSEGKSEEEIKTILDERFPQLRNPVEPEPKDAGCPG